MLSGKSIEVFDGNWLAEGTLVCAVGSNWQHRAEIDDMVVRRADNIVCDSVEACRREAGDFTASIDKGSFDWTRAVDQAAASGRLAPSTRLALDAARALFPPRPLWRSPLDDLMS